MATKFVKYTGGDDGNTGVTWSQAWQTIEYAIDTASWGDLIIVSNTNHSPDYGASAVTWDRDPTSDDNKMYVISATEDDTGSAYTPTAGATITTTGAFNVRGGVYLWGFTFNVGYLARQNTIYGAYFHNCTIAMSNTTSNSNFQWTASRGGYTVFEDCTISGSCSYVITQSGMVYVIGGSITKAAGRAAIFDCFWGADLVMKCVDLSGSAVYPIMSYPYGDDTFTIKGELIGCKLNSSVTDLIYNRTSAFQASRPVARNFMIDSCWSGSATDKPNSIFRDSVEGTAKSDFATYRTSGASDPSGDNFSIKMASSTNVGVHFCWLELPITTKTTSTSSTTFTIEILHDSATNLKEHEVWMELYYPGTGVAGQVLRDRAAVGTIITGTVPDQSAGVGTGSWTISPAMSDANSQKLNVTGTPGQAGPMKALICLAKPSTTIFVDPVITES